jgi:hypothetical protein
MSRLACTLASCLATGKQHAMDSLLGEPRGSGAHCILGPRDPAKFLLHRLPAQAVGWTFPALLPGQRGL